MKYQDLREFIAKLEQQGKLIRIKTPVCPYLEITEISDRVLRAGGAALLFENPIRQTVRHIITLYWRIYLAQPNA